MLHHYHIYSMAGFSSVKIFYSKQQFFPNKKIVGSIILRIPGMK